MSYGRGGWAPYVPVAERRRKAAQEMETLRKKGHPVSPVTVTGRTIASTFWGKAWCDNLESYRDYENRLPRGRTYVRNGSVVDLQIAPLAVTAMVSGSSIYKVSITIAAVPKAQWQSICQDCSGGIESLVELLQGRLSKAVMERLCRQDRGLFPKPSEIRFKCSCPDSASMCKHIAAVLYGVGSRLDQQPELLFRLRSVNEKDLVPSLDRALPLSKTGPAAGKVLETDDLSALFGLELAEADDATDAVSTEAVRPKPGPAKSKASKVSLKKSAAPRAGASNAETPGRSVAARPSASVAKAVEEEKNISARSEPGHKSAEPSAKNTKVSPNPKKRAEHQRSTGGRNAVWDPSDIYTPED
jgi:uncharacterized Zn finger protein